MVSSPPGSFVLRILQARFLEWVAISSPGDLPDPGTEPMSLTLADGFFTTEPPGKSFQNRGREYFTLVHSGLSEWMHHLYDGEIYLIIISPMGVTLIYIMLQTESFPVFLKGRV